MISVVQLESILPHATLLLLFTFFMTTLTGLCQLPWKFWLGSSVTIMFATIEVWILRQDTSGPLLFTSLPLAVFIVISGIIVVEEEDKKSRQLNRSDVIDHNKPQEAKEEAVKPQSCQDQKATKDDASPAK